MISVIVPVYNVEPYLRKCLDSIIEQTYRDLEILVIDDGSTDGSGLICDEFAERDSRIQVFHTENRGLSAARNLGLENAVGEYIGFVDSDDWIEQDMYEVLLRIAEETGADVVGCGFYIGYSGYSLEKKSKCLMVSGTEAVNLLLGAQLSTNVWDKLWKKHCFRSIRFPEGRVYEDIATTYRLLECTEQLITIPESKYHYSRRSGSLSKTHDMKNIVGYWLSHRERYEYFKDIVGENEKIRLLKSCARATARAWALYYGCTREDRYTYSSAFKDMNSFVKSNIPLLGFKNWSIEIRVGCFFSHFYNNVSFGMARFVYKMRRNKIEMDYLLNGTQESKCSTKH